jgi:DNA-binding MarR family transcriptional regulator
LSVLCVNICNDIGIRYRETVHAARYLIGICKNSYSHHADQEPVYGVALIQELRRHGYELSQGTLYPILHDLEEAGYLVREDRVVGGKIRKYYSLTEEGQQTLTEAKGKIRELVDEILGEHDPS